MQTMLEKIIATKKFEVAERSILHPVEELKRQIADQAPPRNFFQAIAKDPVAKPVNVIAEVKKASPSAGLIREAGPGGRGVAGVAEGFHHRSVPGV